jgi:eukaryotic-like serine/threonine-protein kinase
MLVQVLLLLCARHTEDAMLRTSPLPRDAKTVAVARPAPARSQRTPCADVPVGGSILSSCNLFPQTLVSGCTPAGQDTLVKARKNTMEATSPYRTGAIIAERYRLMRQLGRGGMGEVWSAYHLTLNTEVAVKFLSTGAGGNAAKIALERFRFEAQVSAHLGQKTAHVVAVHDAGSDTVGPYLVMEHVHGRTLRFELNRSGPLGLLEAATLLDQVAEALAVAHAFGIVHRDLKPSNLLLVDQPDGTLYVKVADFGIAKALRSDLAVDRPEDTSDGWMLGSPAYMSPEQMGGGGVDARSDMWALGVILYECLTGRLPFPGRSVSELIVNMSVGRFEPPSNVRDTLPTELDVWFHRALAKRKDGRFESVEEMARSFRRVITGRPTRRLPKLVRGFTASAGLMGALLGLRPAPSEAQPEVVIAAPAAIAVPAAVAQPAAIAQAATAQPIPVAAAPIPAIPEDAAKPLRFVRAAASARPLAAAKGAPSATAAAPIAPVEARPAPAATVDAAKHKGLEEAF